MAYIVPYIVLCGVVFGNLGSSLPIQNEIESEDKIPDQFYLGERTYRNPSPSTGKMLLTWNETSKVNPEELGEYAEGDIVEFPKRARNGMVAEISRWPNGVIPYEIQGGFDQKDLTMIQTAINMYHGLTCITFRKKTASDKDYISIINGNGCWSSTVGRMGGKQEVSLQSPECTRTVGTPIHELMHVAGFLHEQNRYERDDYVTIAFENIMEGSGHNFLKADESETTAYGVPYDYWSVMHYSQGAFSVNGEPTIIAKYPSYQNIMGQRKSFSIGDITKLNRMYKCPEKTLQVTVNQSKPSSSTSNTDSTNENTDHSNPTF